jgi:hypothetical protein
VDDQKYSSKEVLTTGHMRAFFIRDHDELTVAFVNERLVCTPCEVISDCEALHTYIYTPMYLITLGVDTISSGKQYVDILETDLDGYPSLVDIC